MVAKRDWRWFLVTIVTTILSACGYAAAFGAIQMTPLFIVAGLPDMAPAIAETEAYVRGDLGDARSFSLDSPKSRVSRIKALRAA